MSRVGNAPVSIPDGVTLTIDADVIKVKGSNGELQKKIPSSVGVSIDDKLVKKLPKLKLISKFGVGNDNIDLNILKNYIYLKSPNISNITGYYQQTPMGFLIRR